MRRRTTLLALVPAILGFSCVSDPAPELTVLAAASLTEAFGDLAAELPDVDLRFSFAGSSALVTQIQEGAPADVFASADERTMQKLVDAGLVDTPVVFAGNELAIAVEPGNPLGITGLADLAREDLVVVLVEPAVPAGAYADQALAAAKVSVTSRSRELDVKAALTKVTTGEADAAIVYATDIGAAGDRADGVEIPDEHNVVVAHTIAVVKATRHRAAAEAFVREVARGAGLESLRRHGFLPAP